ncbi:SpoVA/SpoVAEb family sporulation membrane protein [Bacillota bacterium LX-D]|nr:SpoVA/SpoVAEb family sporulation membrane protein [Bacillota bacterium LX-D]
MKMVKSVQPKPPLIRNAVGAFLSGGLICLIAQLILNGFLALGLNLKDAGTATTVCMIGIGALLTGLGLYDNIAKFAGAGSMIPITGFANSIVAPALEAKTEGPIYGIAAKIFTIAGPVLTYGFIISILIGFIYYFLV